MNQKHSRYYLIASGALNILLLILVLRLSANQQNVTEKAPDLPLQPPSGNPVYLTEDPAPAEAPIPQPTSQQVDAVVDPSLPEKGAEEQRQRIMRALTDNLTNPGMNQAIWNQQRIVLSEKYRDLIKQLGLNGDEAEYFLDLLTARQMLYVNVGMKQMTGALTAEELQTLWQQTQLGIEPINKEIDSFLNNSSDSELMAYYERTEIERTAVDTLEKECERNGLQLPEGNREQLIALIMDEQEKVGFGENFDGDFSKLTEADIARHQEEMSALAPRITQQASGILNAAQLAIWEATYIEYTKDQANWLRMIRQMSQTAE